jgi:hypothetical protein
MFFAPFRVFLDIYHLRLLTTAAARIVNIALIPAAAERMSMFTRKPASTILTMRRLPNHLTPVN